MLKAKYIVPSIKHVFFIISSFPEQSDRYQPSTRAERLSYSEEILKLKNDVIKNDPAWTLVLLSQKEFLKALNNSQSAFFNPENMELLTMNLCKKATTAFDSSYSTCKVLSMAHSEEIIEVFI